MNVKPFTYATTTSRAIPAFEPDGSLAYYQCANNFANTRDDITTCLLYTSDPFDTIEKQGSDPLRWYMITNSQPWDNLKFDIAGVEEVKRKFFGTLYNTYSFFALYANIDKFTYAEAEVPFNERPEIDRWILSLLNSLIKEVTEAYEKYEPTRAGRAIQDFVIENLSNWYVRLSRTRYWGGEQTTDKLSAYQTLYTCLETVAILSSPIAPFYICLLYTSHP